MSDRILVINAGSSSLKYQLLEPETGAVITKGLIERVTDHRVAIKEMLQNFTDAGIDAAGIKGIGHRVVQGGPLFPGPERITESTLRGIESLIPLAPLHNAPHLHGIEAMLEALPSIPNVAVFDTSFHATIPAHAYTYAIDREVAHKYGIRRYGFHGSSHRYVTHRAAELLGVPVDEVNLIIAHIGNGASITAVRNGQSVDTSMGLTPLEGLVMGTRSGDIDPGAIFHLAREAGYGIADIDALLNRSSGMLGMTGESDMREVWAMIEAGDERARLAMDVYVYRLRKYIASYFGVLPDLHAVIFTAGVGENDWQVRQEVIAPLRHLGLTIDQAANLDRSAGDRHIDAGDGPIRVMVIATNEELEIALETVEVLRS
ncbi:MAG: acetate kinase [Candidatus Nanopelagicales bacterium]